MEQRRTILALVLVVVAAGLLVWGLFAKAAIVSSGAQGQKVVTQSEAAITQEVARGGLTRDEKGQIKKTYEEGQQAPKACPT
jgi:hypothetical protein